MYKYFLIVLGDIDNSHYDKMYSRLKSLGEIRKIMDNTFVLKTISPSNETLPKSKEIRDRISLPDYGFCIVIKINKDLSCAWSLTKEGSDIMLNITKGIEDGKEK